MAEVSQAIDIDEIALGLPHRIHQIAANHVAKTPDPNALISDGSSWICRDLDWHVGGSRAKLADLMGFIRFQITPYKRPSEIIVLDSLPATSSGKILKHVLAESLCGAGASGAGRTAPQAAT